MRMPKIVIGLNLKREIIKMDRKIVLGSCTEICEKKSERAYRYYDEECGRKAYYHITYMLSNGKSYNKLLCNRHLKSVTAWLDRIKVPYKHV